MTQDEILDRVVEIIEKYPGKLPDDILPEWQQLNKKMREVSEPTYGLGFWHKGYRIDFLGSSRILYCKESLEQYEDFFRMINREMTSEEYREKWNGPSCGSGGIATNDT